MGRSYFHVHLVSDATGETLISISRAAAAQYEGTAVIEHFYPMVRSRQQIDRVAGELAQAPGIVLYTLVDRELSTQLETICQQNNCPCLSVLDPILALYQSYIGTPSTQRPGAQHALNAEYFRRIEALNYTMMHDDGHLADDLESADVVLVGISRTSKTPTSIYLANRGIKTANIPLVPGLAGLGMLESLRKPLVVGLIASAERIIQIRQNRLLSLNASDESNYVDREAVTEEIVMSRKMCARHGWPLIDVTRRSIEETAAAIMDLLREHRMKFIAQ
ncbi:MAG: pyruvate, water dikinase regulatory protein [Beijerinckiaceae bacterium]